MSNVEPKDETPAPKAVFHVLKLTPLQLGVVSQALQFSIQNIRAQSTDELKTALDRLSSVLGVINEAK